MGPARKGGSSEGGWLQRGACRGDEDSDIDVEGWVRQGTATMTISAKEGQPALATRGLQEDTGRASGDADLRNGRRQETTRASALLKTRESRGRLLILALKSFHATIYRSHVARQVSNATIMDVPVAWGVCPTPRSTRVSDPI
jgi:hypothetical protein